MDLTCKLHSTTELQQSYTIRPKYACTLLGAVVDWWSAGQWFAKASSWLVKVNPLSQ